MTSVACTHTSWQLFVVVLRVLDSIRQRSAIHPDPHVHRGRHVLQHDTPLRRRLRNSLFHQLLKPLFLSLTLCFSRRTLDRDRFHKAQWVSPFTEHNGDTVFEVNKNNAVCYHLSCEKGWLGLSLLLEANLRRSSCTQVAVRYILYGVLQGGRSVWCNVEIFLFKSLKESAG